MFRRKQKHCWKTPGGYVYTLYRQLAENGHLLIAGATGSGKSVALNGIICTLLTSKSPERAKLILCDPKRVELVQYAKLPHVLCYASEHDSIITALQMAVNETERRFSDMQKHGARLYSGSDLYVIIDELADIMTTRKKQALPLIQRLSQIGRAARVHVIACTQNVLAVTIPTTVKCNFPVILALRTATKQQSRYLIDCYGCETLPDPKRTGKGFGYLRDGANITKYQLAMYTDAEINNLVNYWTSSACMV